MNELEYQQYRSENAEIQGDYLTVDEIGRRERTLAYGYDTERNTWHAYIKDSKIHVLLTNHEGHALVYNSAESMPIEAMRPNKRVYPDTVDLDFAQIMRTRGYELPFLGHFSFSTADSVRRQMTRGYKGLTWEDTRV